MECFNIFCDTLDRVAERRELVGKKSALVAKLETQLAGQPRDDKALDALAPRGPDGTGSWVSRDGHFALGHDKHLPHS